MGATSTSGFQLSTSTFAPHVGKRSCACRLTHSTSTAAGLDTNNAFGVGSCEHAKQCSILIDIFQENQARLVNAC